MFEKIPQKVLERLILLFAILLVLAGMGIAGKLDYEDAVLFEQTYKENVCSGIHPDYKGWNIDCKTNQLKQR